MVADGLSRRPDHKRAAVMTSSNMNTLPHPRSMSEQICESQSFSRMQLTAHVQPCCINPPSRVHGGLIVDESNRIVIPSSAAAVKAMHLS